MRMGKSVAWMHKPKVDLVRYERYKPHNLIKKLSSKGVLNISDAEITAKFVHLYEIFSIEHIALKSPTFASTR